MMVNGKGEREREKAINIGAMNVKYNFHALDFSLFVPDDDNNNNKDKGKKLHHERISSSFTFGATNRKIFSLFSLFFCRAASGEKRGAENWRCINIIKIKYDGLQLL
jgi:hypothetical protein